MTIDNQLTGGTPAVSAEYHGSPTVRWGPQTEALVVLAAALTVVSIYFPHQVETVIEARQMADVTRTAQAATDYQDVGSWPFFARLMLALAGLLLGMYGRNRSEARGWRIASEATVGLALVVSAGMAWILVVR